MATLSVQKPAAAGTVLSLVAPTATTGDQYANTGKEMVIVDNASGAPVTVTFKAKRACDTGATLHDLVQSVAAGAREMFPPVDPYWYNDPDTQRVTFIISSVTSVTVGVLAAN